MLGAGPNMTRNGRSTTQTRPGPTGCAPCWIIRPVVGFRCPRSIRTQQEKSVADVLDIPLLDHELADDELAWVQAVYKDFSTARAAFSGREQEFNPKETLREVL